MSRREQASAPTRPPDQPRPRPAPTSPTLCAACGSAESVALFAWQAGDQPAYYCRECRVSSRLLVQACTDLHALAWPALVRWSGRCAAAGLDSDQMADLLACYGQAWRCDAAYTSTDPDPDPARAAVARLLREAHQQATSTPTSNTSTPTPRPGRERKAGR